VSHKHHTALRGVTQASLRAWPAHPNPHPSVEHHVRSQATEQSHPVSLEGFATALWWDARRNTGSWAKGRGTWVLPRAVPQGPAPPLSLNSLLPCCSQRGLDSTGEGGTSALPPKWPQHPRKSPLSECPGAEKQLRDRSGDLSHQALQSYPVMHWAGYLTSAYLVFPTCKMGTINRVGGGIKKAVHVGCLEK
jgi:hypothetical protein